jgi:hypothetical protein
MTIDRAHIEFQVFLDKRSTSQVPEVPPEQIDLYLNEGTLRFVKTRINGNNLYRATGEANQKRRDDLRTLLSTALLTATEVVAEPGVYALDLPSVTDYLQLARLRVKTTYKTCAPEWREPNYTQQDDLERAKRDPFNKSTALNPLAYDEEGDIYVIGGEDFTVNEAKVTYYRLPREVKASSYGGAAVEWDLPEHTHKEIVQLAVEIALETIESPRVQTIKPFNQNIE